MGRSRGELLERALATRAADQDAPVLTRPNDLAGDARMPGEGPEAIPDGRFERVTKLVARRPPLDLDQLVALLLEQLDRVRAPTGASTARERNDGDGGTPAVELVPDRRTPDQLVATGPQSGRVDVRGLPARRRRAAFAGRCLARRARTLEPPACDVDMWDHDRPAAASAAGSPTRAPGSRGGMALGAPLLQPGQRDRSSRAPPRSVDESDAFRARDNVAEAPATTQVRRGLSIW